MAQVGIDKKKVGIQVGIEYDGFTKNQKKSEKIKDMLIGQNLSPKDILNRGEISKSALYRILKNLKKEGWVEGRFYKVGIQGMPIIKSGNSKKKNSAKKGRYFRFHNLHFKVEPYYFYKKYSKVKKGIGTSFGKWTITFNKSNIEFQLKSHESFDSKDIQSTIDMAREGIKTAILTAGDKYGFEVYKEGKVNVFLVNQHIAEVENGVAKAYQGEKLGIKGEDGKTWLLIDKSTGLPELECVHPELATDDMELLQHYFNDLRKNNPPTNSQLATYLKMSLEAQAVYNENIKKHLGVLDKMSISLEEMTEFFRSFKNGKKESNTRLFHKLKQSIATKEDVLLYSKQIKRLNEEENKSLFDYLLNEKRVFG